MNKFATLLIILFLSGCASQQQQQQPPQPPQPPTPPSSPSPPPQPSPPKEEEGKKGEESSEDAGEQSEQEGQEQEGGLELPEVGGEESGQEGGLELPEVGGEESEDGDEDSDTTSKDKDCGGIILIGDVGGMGDTGECSDNPNETSESETSEEESGGGATSEEESSADESGGGAVVSEGESGGSAGEVGQYPEESSAERMERLSEELNKSIEDFDGILMEEQREISSVSRNMEGFGDGEMRQAGKIGLGQQEGGEPSGSTISILNPEGRRAASIERLSKEDIQSRVPEDIILIDDDVVGKQLYEAAVSEDDPELRERLWEEYRKYKRY